MLEDLLRAGPTATREALCHDPTLASFLDPADFARLAAYAKPRPPPRRRVKAGADVLKTMAPHRSIWGQLARLAVRLFIFAALVWLLMPAVRTLQKDGTLPSWASAPVGLAMAGAGVGHLVGTVKPLLMAGTSMPVAIGHVGMAPTIAAAASCVAGLIAATPPSRKGKRVKRDPSGPWRADWLSMREARKIMSHKDGLILGEACVPSDEPHKIGISPLLRMKPKGHILTAAGSGAGKGISVVVPNCLGWGGPLVVHDPAAETLPIVRAHREGMGRTVRVVSLEADTDGVNVLEWLDPEAKTFTADVRTVVSWLDHGENGGDGGDESFNGLAKTLATCLIQFVLTSPDIPDHDRHLLKVRQLGASPNLSELLRTITGMKGVARGAMANAAGMVLRTMQSDETFAGVSMHFDKLTSCLEGMEEILCGMVAQENRFALGDILAGETDFFICLPPDMLDAQPQVPRILLGALATTFLRNLKRVEHDTLFVVDEMPRLTATSPLPLAPGDEVKTIARAELFSPDTGRSMGNAVNPGVAAIVVGMERSDRFVEVRFPIAQGIRALVSAEALEMVE